MWGAIYSILFIIIQTQSGNPCGFFGQDNCFTQLKLKAWWLFSCPYHYSGMQYKKAAEFSKTNLCTNLPSIPPGDPVMERAEYL